MIFDNELIGKKINYKRNFETSNISKIKAGGIADYIIFPKSEDQLIFCVGLCRKFNEDYKVIGACSNVFFGDYSGVVISTKYLRGFVFKSENKVLAACGTNLNQLINVLSQRSKEFASSLFGIPATVGGAVYNNAGAFGSEIADSFINCKVFDPRTGRIFYLNEKDMCFSYRSTALKDTNLVILEVLFKTSYENADNIKKKISEVIEYRKEKHPKEPSLGSFFKRSGDIIPSKIIDLAGLKGKRIGGAEISKKHAGFIINHDNATHNDINSLAALIEKEISDRYRINLVREAEFVSKERL